VHSAARAIDAVMSTAMKMLFRTKRRRIAHLC
jgi:hypothetical protein